MACSYASTGYRDSALNDMNRHERIDVIDNARDAYIEGIDPRWAKAVRDLHEAIMAGGPVLNSRIAYRMFMYTLGEHRRNWVCAIGSTKKGIGVAGTSTLMTIDFVSPGDVDPQLVTEYVEEAVAKFDDFLRSKQT
jgi:hypothetical protein